MSQRRLLLSAAFALLAITPMFAGGPSFHPDVTFHGSSLSGWHVVGQANWRAENGELIGTPQAQDGGWLMLDHSDQKVRNFSPISAAPTTAKSEQCSVSNGKRMAGGYLGVFD